MLKDTVSNYEPMTLQPLQVFNVYVGLKRGEEYQKRYADCLEVANALNDMIQQQNDSLVALDQRLEEYDYQLGQMYDDRERIAVEIQRIKSAKTPWYRHPITLCVVGFAAGVWIAKP